MFGYANIRISCYNIITQGLNNGYTVAGAVGVLLLAVRRVPQWHKYVKHLELQRDSVCAALLFKRIHETAVKIMCFFGKAMQ